MPFGVQLSENVPVTGTSTNKNLLNINSISKLFFLNCTVTDPDFNCILAFAITISAFVEGGLSRQLHQPLYFKAGSSERKNLTFLTCILYASF